MNLLYRVLIVFLCIVLLPLGLVLSVMVVLCAGFPILFRQQRIGKNGRSFTIYKFRTMTVRAEKEKVHLQKQNESDGPVFKIRNDPRFIGIGKFLSHTGLDELPQFINVFRGEMNLIGPRPLPVSEAKKLKPWMRVRERVLPGIISPAILTGLYHTDFNAWMRYDVAYVNSKNPRGDLTLCIDALPFLGRMFFQSILGK